MSVVIQRMTRADLPVVIALNKASMPEVYEPAFWTNHLNQFGDLFYTAKIDDKVVGYIFCRVELIGRTLTGIVISVAVDKEHQSHGIGEQLMNEAHYAMRTRGILMAGLQVRKSNLKAIRMYTKMGYQVNLTIPHYYHGPEEDAWLLTLVL